jgi:hypothetical protein
MSKFNTIKMIYKSGLVVALPITTFIGIVEAPDFYKAPNKNGSPGARSIYGYAAIGFLTGFTYPVTFPITAIWVISTIRRDQIENKKIEK